MFGPTGAAIRTFCEAVHQVVVFVGTRNVPQLPHTVGVDEIGLIDTAALPVFVGGEDGGCLIRPFATVPLEIANGVRAPEIFGCACVVDSLDQVVGVRISACYIGRTVPATFEIPCVAALMRCQGRDSFGIARMWG